MAWCEDEEGERLSSGRRSRPISLATKFGVLVAGEQLLSEERSFVAPTFSLVSPLVLI